jgi:hypothetical protein
MNIRLFKPSLGSEELSAVKDAFDRSWVGLGPRVNEFEEKWAEFVGAKLAIGVNSVAGFETKQGKIYVENENIDVAADPVVKYMSRPEIEKAIQQARKKMEEVVKELDFIQAAQYRDEIYSLEAILKNIKE